MLAFSREWFCTIKMLFRIIGWFGLEVAFKDHLGHHPLPWAGTPFTRSGCSKSHPTRPFQNGYSEGKYNYTEASEQGKEIHVNISQNILLQVSY